MEHEQMRELIMDAVMEEFNEKGLKFTMDDIAKHLGMSKKTLYTIFKDKDTLFDECVDYTFSGIKAAEKEILEDKNLDIVTKIRRIMIVLPGRYQNINLNQISSMQEKYPKVYRKIKKRLESDWEPTLELLREGMRQGKIRKVSLPVLQTMVEGTIEQFFSHDSLAENGMNYEKALEAMMDIIMQGIIAETDI